MPVLPITEDTLRRLGEAARSEEERTSSSHWQEGAAAHHPLIENPLDFANARASSAAVGPLGAISWRTGQKHRIAHRILQTPIRAMGWRYPTYSSADSAARDIADAQGRAYDKDLLRHALTLALLETHAPETLEAGPVAIIGDGFANMSALILARHPRCKVIAVNLARNLLIDCVFANQAIPELQIATAKSPTEIEAALADDNVRMIAVPANHADILAAAPIQLGINILSMMEMDPPVTANYFKILRACPADQTAFYCCNRIEKPLPDGTVTRFFDYPWRNGDKILMDAPCGWTRIAYHGRPPFYYLSSPVQHRLVWLDKSTDASTTR